MKANSGELSSTQSEAMEQLLRMRPYRVLLWVDLYRTAAWTAYTAVILGILTSAGLMFMNYDVSTPILVAFGTVIIGSILVVLVLIGAVLKSLGASRFRAVAQPLILALLTPVGLFMQMQYDFSDMLQHSGKQWLLDRATAGLSFRIRQALTPGITPDQEPRSLRSHLLGWSERLLNSGLCPRCASRAGLEQRCGECGFDPARLQKKCLRMQQANARARLR